MHVLSRNKNPGNTAVPVRIAGSGFILPAALLAAAMFLPARAETVSVACSVQVEYTCNGAVQDHASDCVVAPGVGFVDDRSTATREELFSASL